MINVGTVDDIVFRRFSDLIQLKSGIQIWPKKRCLLHARTRKRMRTLGISDLEQYFNLVEHDSTGRELVELLNAISTNVTHFFREISHFEFLANKVAQWEAGGQEQFRIWSAGSATGEEAYSIAITLCECLGCSDQARVLASDLSTQALETARVGEYAKRQLAKVPAQLLARYFHRLPENEQNLETYRVSDRLKGMISLARINLAAPPYPIRSGLDLIFCRNVMIYFDNSTRKHVLDNMFKLLKPGGFLFVGHSESLTGMFSAFKPVVPSIYTKD